MVQQSTVDRIRQRRTSATGDSSSPSVRRKWGKGKGQKGKPIVISSDDDDMDLEIGGRKERSVVRVDESGTSTRLFTNDAARQPASLHSSRLRTEHLRQTRDFLGPPVSSGSVTHGTDFPRKASAYRPTDDARTRLRQLSSSVSRVTEIRDNELPAPSRHGAAMCLATLGTLDTDGGGDILKSFGSSFRPKNVKKECLDE